MIQVNKKQVSSAWLSGAVCFLASLFYLYEFTLQVSPGVMTHELMKAYNIGAVGLGTISAFYFYAYAPMQLPAGVLFDRFGPRVLLPIATLICAFGALFFSVTHSVLMASCGRFMMGFGSAFSFIGTLLLVSRWFPLRYFAILAGLVQAMSSIGAIFGETPLAGAIQKFGWRPSMIALSFIGVVLAIAIWVVVRDYPEGKKPDMQGKRRPGQSLKGLGSVLSSQQTWWVAIYSFLIWAPIVIFAALWGVPFIVERYGVSTAVAASAVSLVWVGIGVGSPLIGWISEKSGLRCTPLWFCGIIGGISSGLILYMPGLPFAFTYIALFGFGLAASGQSLSFAVVTDVTEPKYVGTAIGFNNMAVVAGGAVFQPLVGFLLHLFWTGTVYDAVPYYSLLDFQKSLWIIPVCYLLAAMASFTFIRETHCRRMYDPHSTDSNSTQGPRMGENIQTV